VPPTYCPPPELVEAIRRECLTCWRQNPTMARALQAMATALLKAAIDGIPEVGDAFRARAMPAEHMQSPDAHLNHFDVHVFCASGLEYGAMGAAIHDTLVELRHRTVERLSASKLGISHVRPVWLNTDPRKRFSPTFRVYYLEYPSIPKTPKDPQPNE